MSVQYSLDEIKLICEEHDIKHYALIEEYFKRNSDATNKSNHLNLLQSRLNDLINYTK